MQILHDKNTKTFIAILNKKRIGYLKYSFPKDASAKRGNRNVQIDYIFVNKAYRRRGIASALISGLLLFSKNLVWVSLWTGKEAEINKTYGLYKKHGFFQKALCPDYYENGVATRLFVKKMQ